ncbi:hypothetical protein COB11_05130 [Candidatus Aerophobetes bacterium]|uniref:Uncharacterized protein n=1 Tax=Aerophobetes bacterium TaxID=2030807 RepID=A0A2A4YFC9_UNCAE|nr:MAG: hypothetical protein COB11_05130 [Candidatus Aerophobetes bacterium]
MKKVLFWIFGIFLGCFMLVNSAICFYRYLNGYSRVTSPQEWLTSFILTFVVGVVLIIWTSLLLKKQN